MNDPALPTIGFRQADLLRRGFLWILWGAFLFCAVAFDAVRLTWTESRGWPGHLIGIPMVLWGAWLIHRALHTTWSRAALRCALLQLYCTPFYFWWTRVPYNPLFFINTLVGIACLIGLLVCLNRIMTMLAERINDAFWRHHASLALALTLLTLAAPFVAILAAALIECLRFGDNYYFAVRDLLLRQPWWIIALPLLPLPATLSNCWYAQSKMRESVERAG